jgi:hypothetical protein
MLYECGGCSLSRFRPAAVRNAVRHAAPQDMFCKIAAALFGGNRRTFDKAKKL